MAFFHSNIRLLRSRKKISQEDLAGVLNLKRSTLSSYECGTVEPNLEKIVNYSNFFKISIDDLVKTDLSEISEFELSQMEKGFTMKSIKQ